jgi:hypothetical protein
MVNGLSIRFFRAHSAISFGKVVSVAALRMPRTTGVGTRGSSGPGASVSTTGTNLPVLAPSIIASNFYTWGQASFAASVSGTRQTGL